MIDAYRDAGYASFKPVANDTCQLGTARRLRLSAGMRWTATKRGSTHRQTTYRLLATPDGWRILSYTIHF
jgi:hypothetical protein